MAGKKFTRSGSSNSRSLTEMAGAQQMHVDGLMATNGGRGRTLNNEGGYTGKLRLARSALFKKKPYDRPSHSGSLDRPLSTGFNRPIPSLPSRLVDSASNLIVSSASYLFDSFFKRRQTLWIGNSTRSTARTNSADMEHKDGSKPPLDNLDKDIIPPLQGPSPEAHHEKFEEDDLDLAKVEGILKQRFLSREEVKRLTDVLRSQTSRGHMAGSSLEAHRQQEKIQQVEEELNPVQLAKDYMGQCTSHFVSATPQWQSTAYRYGEGAGSSSIKRIKEEVYERSPAQASKSSLASAERMLKRRLIADDESNVISRGPTRRVRQKMTIVANTSPYIKQVTAASGLRTSSVPLLQVSDMTEKVNEGIKEPMLPANKGKSVEEPAVVVSCNDADAPESSKVRKNLEAFSKRDSGVLPTSGDLDMPNCKPSVEHVEPMAPTVSKAIENSATGSLPASPSELPIIIPDRTKGFHMSAFFEDSSSDEESGSPVQTLTSSEAQRPGSSTSQGALQENTQKQPSALMSNDGSFSSAAESTKKSSPPLLQPTIAAGPSNTNLPVASSLATHSWDSPSTLASTLAMGRSIPLLSNLKPLPVVSLAPSAPEKELLPFTPASARAPSSDILSTPPISAFPSGPTTLPATSVSFSVQGGAAVAVAPSSLVGEVEPPSLIQKVAAAEGVAAKASGLSPVATSLSAATGVAETASIVAPSFTTPAAASKPLVALVTTAASISPVGTAASLAAIPANVPVVFHASTGGAQVDSLTAADSFLKAGSGVAFTSGSPGADRQADGDTMATDPMTEEPDSSFISSSPSPFLFGSVSTAPTSSGQMPSFGSGGTSTSPFSFPMPSAAPSAASLSAQFPFSSQSSSSAGQLFTFGASGTSPSNPFSVNTQSSFSFGSSAASPASPIFTATSSAPLTFPATPAAPSFQFGAHAASSSSTSSTSMFEAQMTPIASAFAVPGGQSNASGFVFSAPPTSSGTPMQSSFQFGGAGAGASVSSFGGQSFTFGGQPTPTAGNPFAQNVALNVAPFQFGTSAATPSQSVFQSGAATPSPLSFGAQPSGSPFPFTFGGQPGAPPTGQPFSFGGQPAAAAPSSFTSSGATGQNSFGAAGASGMDFGVGFSVGAAGGEKSSRKYIKAKRTGGTKRVK